MRSTEPAGRAAPGIHNRVLLLLGIAGGVALASGGFLDMAPNRLASGAALPVWTLSLLAGAAIAAPLAAFILLAFVANDKLRSLATLICAALLLYACLVDAALLAGDLVSPDKPALRLSLGAAYWIPLACALFAFLDAMQRLQFGLVARVSLFVLLSLPFAILADAGTFDALSLTKEFENHQAAFAQALFDHLVLVGLSLLIALLIAIPIIFAVRWKSGLRNLVYASLGVIQAVPSIALFGLLIAPLSALVLHVPLLAQFGISGTGRTPAIIALVLYALLPLVRNGMTGLDAVSPDVRDAAKGLGFTASERVLKVDLPLALPALLSGMRVVTVQAIGLASVAALIGAGGLGTFVFQGIGQYALDLVLVGAIPIILLALSADLGFQLLLSAARGRA